MNPTVQPIPFASLALIFLPAMAVVALSYRWSLDYRTFLLAMGRMLVQLLLIGYVLVFIFETERPSVVLAVIGVMVLASSWIGLRTLRSRRRQLYGVTLLSIALGGGVTLALVVLGVLDLEPWYLPRYFIPIAGMIFANAMNSISLAAERLNAELGRDVAYDQARGIALGAALIPITNSLFAVGLVSLPGMMTGQILSGVSPLTAVRYQIMVMAMLFGSAGISTVCFLVLARPRMSREAPSSQAG